jgi:pimeloyl-ACP methyl ester carboxylesterase
MRGRQLMERLGVHEIRKTPGVDGYERITLKSQRGEIICRNYPALDAFTGVIWVGGIGGDWDTPARDLYPALCKTLLAEQIASLRVQFRYPGDLDEAVYDLLSGIAFLEELGIHKIALVGHSFGGAVVIQAASYAMTVKTVVTLSTQSYGAGRVLRLPEDCAILLIHGAEDPVLPPSCSQQVYRMAHPPKELVILPSNGHCLEESADKVKVLVYNWIISELKREVW